MDGVTQKIEAALAFRFRGTDQGRLVLPPWIEQEPGAGLNDAAQIIFLKELVHPIHLFGQISFVRIERMVIERYGDTAVAKFSEDVYRVFQAMMGETIRVVAEEHTAMVRFQFYLSQSI
jgi:hypothetical protein